MASMATHAMGRYYHTSYPSQCTPSGFLGTPNFNIRSTSAVLRRYLLLRVKCIGRFAGSFNNLPHFQVGLQPVSLYIHVEKHHCVAVKSVPCLRGPSGNALEPRYKCF
jgi:hypothetical protein